MNDSPGWASPGSAPSDGQEPGVPRPAEPTGQGEAAPKWSSNQPPAAQWTPPSPAPVPPQQTSRRGPRAQSGNGGGRQNTGWGGPPQNGWGYQQPVVAKPGIIPLRPLGVGEILDGAVSTMRAHWRTALGLTIGVAAAVQLCSILVQHYLLPEPTQIDSGAGPTEQLHQSVDSLRTTLIGLGPLYAITLIGTIFTTAVLTMVVSRSVLGRPVTLADAWREARPQLSRLVGLSLLLPVAYAAVMTVGLLPGLLVGGSEGAGLAALGGLAAVVVVVWLWICFSLAGPALMLERQGIAAALRRSAKLVKGVWWRIFGITLLTLLLTALVSGLIDLPFNAAATMADGKSVSDLVSSRAPEFGWPYLIISGIGATLTAALTYPFTAGVTVLLYVDQRIRREALDIDLARSAGVPGYEPSGS
ncbi:hypothetical protein [Streptomyces sp. NBC_01306]|uniref:hypothetical protein n=1 Tax=Streptomyces sp. NBC_01306 TaxID=2903819 RepID=UPI002251BA9F|nr:hypothetical protein [Streptomyces sp. NBC_01306]MCX4726220.1 hypothetical protein [Streptomyces sp. NBC_01306]